MEMVCLAIFVLKQLNIIGLSSPMLTDKATRAEWLVKYQDGY